MRRYQGVVYQGASALGSPATFFAPAKFLPSRSALKQAPPREPVDGVDVTHGQCLCEFMRDNELGQGCAVPTAGATGGSAEYGTDAAKPGGGNTLLTVAAVGGVGVAALFVLGIL